MASRGCGDVKRGRGTPLPAPISTVNSLANRAYKENYQVAEYASTTQNQIKTIVSCIVPSKGGASAVVQVPYKISCDLHEWVDIEERQQFEDSGWRYFLVGKDGADPDLEDQFFCWRTDNF